MVSFCFCVVVKGLHSASLRAWSVLAPDVPPAASRFNIPDSQAHSSSPWLLFYHLRLEVGRETDKAVTDLLISSYLYTSNYSFLGFVHRISQFCLFSSHPFTVNVPSAQLTHLTPSGAGHLECHLFLAASLVPLSRIKTVLLSSWNHHSVLNCFSWYFGLCLI